MGVIYQCGVVPTVGQRSRQYRAPMMEDARQLIRRAFEQARASGKPDWHRMTSAVLKNRLLSLTDNSFNEEEYGASTFMMFISKCSDLVDVDKSRFPPIVELRDSELEDLAPSHVDSTSSRPRIRSDLWQASLDYSSGTQYVWDLTDRMARPIRFGESSPTIPSVTQAVLQEWRQDFIDDQRKTDSISPEQESQVDFWITQHLPTSYLPSPLIPQWNGFLRDKVYEHLLSWFNDSEIDPPSDLISKGSERTTSRPSDTEALRRLILRVVGQMTERELAQLNLPPKAILRATRKSRL